MKKRELVLVTGGAGFIGSHLVDALVKDGYSVRILDNISSPTHKANKMPDWLNKKAEFIKGDVRVKKDWVKALDGVSYVYHFAAYMDYHPDFSKYVDTNTRSTALLYEVAVSLKLPLKKVIYASSQSVYGEGKYECPIHGVFYAEARTESQLKRHEWDVLCPKDNMVSKILPELETDELRPQIPYGITKAASEKLCLTLGKTYNIPTVVVRPSIAQGSRQSIRNFSGALKDFSIKAIAGVPILMYEDAGSIRDFVNVHDLVDAYLLVLKNKKADYEIFNVGSGQDTTLMELSKTVCKVAGSTSTLGTTGEFRVNSPRNSRMNVDKLKKLGWMPKRSLEDNISEYIAWVKKYPKAIEAWKKTHKQMIKEGALRT